MWQAWHPAERKRRPEAAFRAYDEGAALGVPRQRPDVQVSPLWQSLVASQRLPTLPVTQTQRVGKGPEPVVQPHLPFWQSPPLSQRSPSAPAVQTCAPVAHPLAVPLGPTLQWVSAAQGAPGLPSVQKSRPCVWQNIPDGHALAEQVGGSAAVDGKHTFMTPVPGTERHLKPPVHSLSSSQ